MQWSSFEILICFNSSITEHWTPYIKHPHIFPNDLLNWEIFVALESARWKATNVIWASEGKEQCVRIQPPLIS